jgi:hypothetical protein
MPSRALVVDANILVRAVLGKRVRELIEAYAGDASFFVPEGAYAEAEEHLAALVIKRGGDPEKGARTLALLGSADGTDRKRGVQRFRSRSSRAVGPTRSRGLAHAGCGTRPWVPNLDGRHRFLRVWCSHVDIRPRPDVPSRVTFGAFLAEVRTLRSCPGCSIETANLRSSSTFGQSLPGDLSTINERPFGRQSKSHMDTRGFTNWLDISSWVQDRQITHLRNSGCWRKKGTD